MINWRKRNEGFEWREYVRTTILVRREERKRRVKDAQAAAVAGLKAAGQRGLDAGAAGANAAGQGVREAAKAAAASAGGMARKTAEGAVPLAGSLVRNAGLALASSLEALGGLIARAGGPSLADKLAPLRRPGIAMALELGTPALALAAIYRGRAFGFDADAIAAAALALAGGLLLLALKATRPALTDDASTPSIWDRVGKALTTLPGLHHVSPRGAVAAGLAAAAIVTFASANPGATPQPLLETASITPKAATAVDTSPATGTLSGRATALTGGRLKISGTIVAIAGIEAPDPDQTCTRSNGATWRCGAHAKDELARLMRGKQISCTLNGRDKSGTALGTCKANGEDIAAKLVRTGKVFAEPGFFAPYTSAEDTARAEKAGIWAGTAERPADWQARRAAKADARRS